MNLFSQAPIKLKIATDFIQVSRQFPFGRIVFSLIGFMVRETPILNTSRNISEQ